MANNYRIEIKIEIVKCTDESTTTIPIRQENGQYTFVLVEGQAACIDACEQALLKTGFTAIREALAQHYSAISLERAQAIAQSASEIQIQPYRVDGEAGRITFEAHSVEREGEVMFDTARDLFAPLGPKEWYRTQGFKELALVYGVVDDSYRKTSALLNRVRYQETGGTPVRTLWDNAEAEGRQLQAHIEQFAAETLQVHRFTPEGTPPEAADYRGLSMLTLPVKQVTAAIQECAPQAEWVAEMESNPVAYEDPSRSVLVAIDEVGVKQQTAPRGQPAASEEAEQPAFAEQKRIHHTVARVAQGTSAYILNGRGVASVLKLVLAFLLHNQLLDGNLIFFVDGQRSLHMAILLAFAWFAPLQIILDWYHLLEKCKQQLSLALKGRSIRNTVLSSLRPLLWHGCLTQAIVTLRGIPADQIKDQAALDKLIGYFERNRSSIPCYAVRKKLGLRNSSQAGEKANDLVVSSRQKHNGMSWCPRGSTALASITTLVKNREHLRWFSNQTLAFSFAA